MPNRPAHLASMDTATARPPSGGAAHPVLRRLQPVFEELGLNGYQSRVLLALLQAGTATAVQLAMLSGVPRTSVYPVLNELEARRLVNQVPGRSSSWVSPGEEEVLDRLYAEQQERFRSLEDKVQGARKLLAQLPVSAHSGGLPYVQVIPSVAQSKLAFEQALAATRSELLMFTRPPWSWPKEGSGNETVLGTLARGVKARALYQASDLTSESAASLAELGEYHAAGTEGRVVAELPMKLAIFDRTTVLLALADPVTPDVGFPTSLLVQHPGYSGMQALAFESMWESAQPYDEFEVSKPSPVRGTRRAGTTKSAKR